MARSEVLILGIVLEGGLGLLAIAVGSWFGRNPLSYLAWDRRDAMWGVAATGPLLLVLAACLRSNWRPLARLRSFFDEVAVPWLSGCTLLDLAVLSLAAGIGEELLFRGLIQGWLADALRPEIGLAIASILFGFAHAITSTYVVVAGLMGVYLGAVWMISGNLLVPIVAHALYDFLALIRLIRLRDGNKPQRAGDQAPGG